MQKTERKRRLLCLLTALCLALSLAACSATDAPPTSRAETAAENSPAVVEAPASETPEEAKLPSVDPSGAAFTPPEKLDSIAVLAPSLAETVIALGMGGSITACDSNSLGLEGLPEGIPALDTVNPDMEQLAALHPDLLLVSNLSLYDQEAPYQPLVDLGVSVVCVPTSDSIADIQSDIAFVAALLGKTAEGEALIGDMQEQIDRIAAIGAAISEKKTVYFEISPAPYLYSFGSGVFLNELIELAGAENILAGQKGWLSIGEESILEADPDVILTNVNYTEDPIGEILSRPGWEVLKAVQNGQVYAIDNNASSLPDHNVVKALEQIAQAVYPTYYGA